MRRFLFAAILLLAGCSRAADTSQTAASADSAAGPQVGVSAAPGMSLNYAYGFRLPVERIAGAQEDNASQCEALGPATCRITGMTYEVSRNRTVSATLLLKLAPPSARQFGKQAIAAVVKHGGMLALAHIDSEDSGAVVAAAVDQKASLESERARIEKQLAVPGLGSAERRGLQDQLTTLAGSTRDAQTAQRDAAVKLASTPMTLTYETGEVDQSLSDGQIVGAFKDGWVNVVAGVAVIITILVTLLPWIACAVLIGWLLQKYVFKRAVPETPKEDAERET